MRQAFGAVTEAELAATDLLHQSREGVPRDGVVLDERGERHVVVEQGGDDLAEAVVELDRLAMLERDVGGDVRAVGLEAGSLGLLDRRVLDDEQIV